MSTYELVADLPLRIDDYSLEGMQEDVSTGFTRKSTVIHLAGGGEEGVGEDVTYDAVDHEIAWKAGPSLALAGDWTIASFAEHLATLDPFPEEPQRDVSRLYRTWAYESAALDLALRQAGKPLHEVLGREPRPVTFVVSLRLGEPPSLEPLTLRLERYPTLRFKLDPTPSWDMNIIAGLVATGAVDSLDFKGLYSGTVVDVPADPLLPGSRTPSSSRRSTSCSSPTASASRGTPTSTRSPTSKACRSRRGWSTSSRRGWAASSRCWTPTTTPPSAGSAPTGAASSSSVPAAGRSSTSRR
jgi:hypothetical protein